MVPHHVGRDCDNWIADIMNSIAKIVISTTLTRADWNNTRVISGEVEKELAALRDQPGKDIAIFGSSALTVDVLGAELLDELRLMVNPVALGTGASVLKGADLTDFDLLRTRPFKAGNIQLAYAPKG